MEPASGQRNAAKEQYANVRRSLADFEERVVARYWDENTLARTSFGRFLGSLDRVAGWLLADDELSRRGRALMRQTEDPAARVEEEPAGDITGDQPEQLGTQPIRDEVNPPDGGGEADAVTGEEEGAARLVDVTFAFPADVQAANVVLCGEFNQWSVEGVRLERGDDGVWRTVVALEPGRSYRYRYLIDGERWENAPDADSYEPNPYGSVDSVLSVELPAG
jgi:hypothetical protein